jgi:hypothetical protein
MDTNDLAKSSQVFIDAVVDDFITGFVGTTFVPRTKIHTNAFANGFESFKDFDIRTGV